MAAQIDRRPTDGLGDFRRRREGGQPSMAVLTQDRPTTLVESIPAADPAPLGLAAFALTTFLLSGNNASFIPESVWIGPALFYGGLAQFTAGMWEFRNRNVFGATAFSTYGGVWVGPGILVVLWDVGKPFAATPPGSNLTHGPPGVLFWLPVFHPHILLWCIPCWTAGF